MTLARKLALFLLLAAVAPLLGVGFALLARVQRTLVAQAADAQQLRADAAAAGVAADLARAASDLQGFVDTWRPERLSDAELQGLLVVLANQVAEADAAALVDAAGSARAVVDEAAGGGVSTRAFLDALEAARGAPDGQLVLAVYEDPERGPLLAAVRPLAARGGRWLLGARLAAGALRRRLDAAAPPEGSAWLVDAAGAPLVASSRAEPLDPEDRAELAAAVAPAARGAAAGRRLVAAHAPLPGHGGLGVTVALPARVAYADVIATRRAVLATSGAVLAAVLLAAGLLARRLTRGLARIDGAARALGAGEIEVRLPEGGGDEVAAVSRTFNVMAGELGRARARLQSWNDDLRREVALRTRELEAAHAQLLEARKLAALGQLGAGVAHEINNPLSGILGNAQLLLEGRPADDPDLEPLAAIERAARRCRDITQKLLRFSQQRAAPEHEELALSDVVHEALALAGTALRDEGLAVEVALADPGPRVRGDPGHLTQVLLELLTNARTACAGRPGARIRIRTSQEDGLAALAVEDGGKGIAPEHLARIFEPFFTTKDRWSDVGLGLSVAYRVVAEHGGRIDVSSREGEGSVFVVRLPALPGAV